MRSARSFAVLVSFGLALFAASVAAQEKPAEPADDVFVQDLKLLQGKWELFHGNEGAGAPTIHSVKEIVGNRETLRRYDVASGKMTREHSVDFTLTRSGEVRVFTFYSSGGSPKQGLSFVYRVDRENFYDVSGVLQGDTYRNYQESPKVWHWKRVKQGAPEPGTPNPPPKRAEIPAALLQDLEALGVKVNSVADGYSLDVRRKPGFADKEIELIVQCPQVVDLTLEGVSITDRGLEKLKALPELRRLILNDCAISAEGLKALAELPLRETLTSIGLRGTKIKDDDLNWIKDFKRLQRLDVSRTGLTDASLPALQLLPLRVFTATDVPFSAAALQQLQEKYPKLILNR